MRHLVLIGAGPHGLAVLAALAARRAWPERVTVVDPQSGWCSAWDGKLARLDLDRLRSPQVHHPGVRPMELRDLVEALPAGVQAEYRRPEAERVPTPAGMRRFIDGLAARLGPHERLLATATAIAHAPGAGDGDAAPVQVHLSRRDGAPLRPLEADAVVVAHNPSFPRIPAWSAGLIADGRATHASQIDLRTVRVAGRRVVIVGGGLTAACLALGAADRGAAVTMVSRRPLRARPYDVDAGWLGPKRLAHYRAASPAGRRDLIDAARDGGTIPPRTLGLLRDRAAGGAIDLREGVDTEAATDEILGRDDAARAWLATGFAQDLERDALLGPFVRALRVPVHRGLPEVDDGLRLGRSPVHVTGPYAALAVGPACRNLAGARPAAQRIAAALAAMTPTAA